MRATSPLVALSLVLGSGAGFAQQPAFDVDPNLASAPAAPESITGVDCELVVPSFDVTLATGDIRILGVAKSDNNGKWFFSGTNGAAATNMMWIFDSDALGRPDANTRRSVGQSPLRVSPFWGHRDGEWDPVGGMTYWGDEAQKVMEFDPITETWTGNAWALPAFGQVVIRGLAVITDPSGNKRAYGCDFGGSIQEYVLGPGTGASSPVISGPRAVAPSPGSTYGLTIVDGPSGPNSALAVFGQLQNTCTPAANIGLHRVTVVDIATGVTLWSRSGDFGLAGDPAYPFGGIAGGIQVATVAGQRVLAAVHQTLSDAVAFLPFQGFAQHGADECNNAYLYMTGSPTLGQNTGFAVARALPNALAVVYIDSTAGFGIPIGCGVLNVGVSIQPFIIPTDSAGAGSIGPFPIPNFPFFDGVVLYSDSILANLTTLASTNPLEILLTRRCW